MSEQTVRLGVRLPNSGPFATAEHILGVAQHVEDAGYDTVWIHDHISWARDKLTHFATGSIEACTDQDPNFYESIATAGVLGGRLRRARIGIAGLVLPLRDPRVFAKQVATLDRLTGSRLFLAFGIGAITGDFELMGVRFDRRGRIMNDHLGALRAIFGETQPVQYESTTISFANGTFYPRPLGLPLWVTGASDAGLDRAVKYADGWMTVYVTREEYRKDIERLQERLAAAGKPADALDTGYETYVCVAKTHEEAVKISRETLEHKFKSLEKGHAVCMVGTPDEVIGQIAAYRDAGARNVELKFVCHDTTQLRWMADAVAAKAPRGWLAG